MLENNSLSKLSHYVLAALMFVAVAFAAGAYHLNMKVNDINSAWLSFKSQHAETVRLETSLLATLGYGGMVHNFKNYVLRKDFYSLSRFQESLGASQSIVGQYIALSSSQAEKLVLEDIAQMLDQYNVSLQKARDEIKKNKTSKQIDALVKVDDYYALRGLKILHETILIEYEYYRDENKKPVLVNLIRSKMGYGGMIHAFKNYVLRGDEKYLLKAKDSIEEIEGLIYRYTKLGHSLGEKTALEDIRKTLNQYKTKLNLVSKMLKNGATPEEIDQAVRVNDKHALLGLRTLERDIILQIEKKSEEFSLKILSIKTDEALSTVIIVSLITILAIFIYMLFTKRIIQPVQELSEVMTEMAHGNIEIDYTYSTHANTELGAMARSLKVFKKNEQKRRIAEEEVLLLAMTDPLTGLANRHQLEEKYKDITSFAKREGRLVALFALDLDKFKPVNDEYGHAAGDAVLQHVAKNLLLAFRDTDLVVRTGGDEFVIIFFGPENMEAIKIVAQRVIDLLSIPVLVDKDLLTIGCSAGIAIREPDSTESMEVLLTRADKALYKAKASGRNTYRIAGIETIDETIVCIPQKKIAKS